jgi:hypothetical protein
MYFAPIGPGNLALSGGGIPGYPDNGTGYMEVPDANMTFHLVSGTHFGLISFDGAEFVGGPTTLEVIGHKVMGQTVTNYFSVNSMNFQTFSLDSSFLDVGQVDVINARWSLDNLIFSVVPEPTACALASIAALCWFARKRALGRRTR